MKITKEMRADIIDRCIKATFAKRVEKHNASRVKLGDALYQRTYAAAEKLAAKLPREWQCTTGAVTIQHDGFSHRYTSKPDPNVAKGELKLSRLRLAPHTGTLYIKVTKEDELHKQADDVARAEVAIHKESEALKDKLTRMLSSISTDKQLMEMWPEGKKFFPDFTPPARGMVPVSLINSVNATIQANA